MNLTGTIELETNRLKLRRLRKDEQDIYYVYHYLDNDERVMSMVRPIMEPLGNNTELYLELTSKRYQDPTFYNWGIVLKETDIIIGTIEIFNVDKDHGYGEVGFRLAYNFWRCGYMSEALQRVIDFAFKEVGFTKLCAYHDEMNIGAQKVLEKVNFKLRRSIDTGIKKDGRSLCLNVLQLLNE